VVQHGNGIAMQECSLRMLKNRTATIKYYSFVMNMFISYEYVYKCMHLPTNSTRPAETT